jgi:hypothetical protein
VGAASAAAAEAAAEGASASYAAAETAASKAADAAAADAEASVKGRRVMLGMLKGRSGDMTPMEPPLGKPMSR